MPKVTAKPIEARLVGKRKPPMDISPKEKPVAKIESKPASKSADTEEKPDETVVDAKPTSPAPSPVVAVPLPFDPVFYTWREVDVTAKLKKDGSPPYPKGAAKAGISGRVTIEVWVDENGKVDDVKVIEADPPGYFEEATLAYYRTLPFAPAMKEGKAKRYRARFLVEFGESIVVLNSGKAE
ncbi:MAG: TonB family protein [Pseudomonadota bacterium]